LVAIYHRRRRTKQLRDLVFRATIHTPRKSACFTARTSVQACGPRPSWREVDFCRCAIRSGYVVDCFQKEQKPLTLHRHLGGTLFTAKAAKEIILSAGSVGTPSILLHSGIGDQATLTDLGIPTLLDLPSVGRNASDQPLFGAGWFVNSTQTLESITQNATRFNEAFAQWNRSHTGPFSAQEVTHIAWLRLSPETFTLNNFTDPSAGPDSPHIEVAWGVSASNCLVQLIIIGLGAIFF
jgi:hypothetical protein